MNFKHEVLDTLKRVINLYVLYIGIYPIGILLALIAMHFYQSFNLNESIWFKILTGIIIGISYAIISYAIFVIYCDNKGKFRIWR